MEKSLVNTMAGWLMVRIKGGSTRVDWLNVSTSCWQYSSG